VISDIVRPPARWTLVHIDRSSNTFAKPERLFLGRICVDAEERIGRLRHWRRLSFVSRTIDLIGDALVDYIELFTPDVMIFAKNPNESIDWIIRCCPPVDLTVWHIRLIVVFRMALSTIRHQLDESHAAA
jgi:hypothetical protein